MSGKWPCFSRNRSERCSKIIKKQTSINMTRVSRKTDKNELIKAQVTYTGTQYAPVTHREVIDTIDSYIRDNQLPLRNESYLQASNGQRMIGKLVFDYPDKEG